jgi:drug/metabolite transporter (DMT)-like permease
MLHQPSGRRALGFALALLTMLLWGVLPFALHLALASLDAATLTWFRFLVSTLVVGGWLALQGRLPALAGLSRAGWALLLVATLGLAANYIGFLLGLDRTTPANAQVLIQLGPLLLALGAIAVFGERFGAPQWLGFAVLIAGLGLFFRSQLEALARDLDRYLSGVGLIAFAALSWAMYGLAQKQLLRALSSQGVMLCIYLGCTLCFWPWSHPSALAGLSAGALAVLLFCAANTVVAYGAFAAALDHWEASRISAVLALTPLATLACSALAVQVAPARFAAEQLSATSLAGAGLVVAGSLLTSLGVRRTPAEPGQEPASS